MSWVSNASWWVTQQGYQDTVPSQGPKTHPPHTPEAFPFTSYLFPEIISLHWVRSTIMTSTGKHISSPILHDFPDSSNTWSCPKVCIIWAFVFLYNSICGRNKIIRPKSFTELHRGKEVPFLLSFFHFITTNLDKILVSLNN